MRARQNDAAEYSENDGSLFRITSTQAMTTRDKPKPLNTLLNPAGSGDTAAMQVKKQNKKGLLAPLPGKFSVTECVRRRRRSKNAGNGMNK